MVRGEACSRAGDAILQRRETRRRLQWVFAAFGCPLTCGWSPNLSASWIVVVHNRDIDQAFAKCNSCGVGRVDADALELAHYDAKLSGWWRLCEYDCA